MVFGGVVAWRGRWLDGGVVRRAVGWVVLRRVRIHRGAPAASGVCDTARGRLERGTARWARAASR